MYADGFLSERNVRGFESSYVHGGRRLPRRRNLQPKHGPVLKPDGIRWDGMHGIQSLQRDLRVCERRLYREQSGRLHGFGAMPGRSDLQSDDGNVLDFDGSGRHGVQRRECVHDERYMHGRCLRRYGGDMHGERTVHYSRNLRPNHGEMFEHAGAEWNRVHRPERLPNVLLPKRVLLGSTAGLPSS